MSLPVLEAVSSASETIDTNRRHHDAADTLILSELNPNTVVDQLDGFNAPLDLTTFGTVRETCPKCGKNHLKLVLRQDRVRTEHLFCSACESCFDAHYPSGVPALTI